MPTVKLTATADSRPPEAAGQVDPEVRMFVDALRRRGIHFALRDGGGLRVWPAGKLKGNETLVLQGRMHQVREILEEEEEVVT